MFRQALAEFIIIKLVVAVVVHDAKFSSQTNNTPCAVLLQGSLQSSHDALDLRITVLRGIGFFVCEVRRMRGGEVRPEPR